MFRKKEKTQLPGAEELIARIEEMEKEVEKTREEISSLREKQQSALQNFSVIRFNPFSDRGGDQSFSIALLDKEKNGVIITSYYSKEGNRVYSKFLKRGESEHPLSKEEEEAIKKAYEEK